MCCCLCHTSEQPVSLGCGLMMPLSSDLDLLIKWEHPLNALLIQTSSCAEGFLECCLWSCSKAPLSSIGGWIQWGTRQLAGHLIQDLSDTNSETFVVLGVSESFRGRASLGVCNAFRGTFTDAHAPSAAAAPLLTTAGTSLMQMASAPVSALLHFTSAQTLDVSTPSSSVRSCWQRNNAHIITNTKDFQWNAWSLLNRISEQTKNSSLRSIGFQIKMDQVNVTVSTLHFSVHFLLKQ